jgi:transcriptional regulator with XRE-family HTH domain
VRADSGNVCYVARVHPDRSEFARLLAAIQERTGLSDHAIAEVTGVNRSQVWRWTHAGSAPGYEPVRRLTAWLTAERPEVAEPASRLLAAAGYENVPAAIPSDDDLPPVLRGLDPREIEPFLVAVDQDLADRLNGGDPFDDFEHGILRNDEHTLDAKRVLLAIGRMYRAGVLPGQSRNRSTGLTLAIPLSARRGAMR